MDKEKVTYRIALSADKKRWRAYGNGVEHIADKIYIRTFQAETETHEDRSRQTTPHNYIGPQFVIKATGILRKIESNGKTFIFIE